MDCFEDPGQPAKCRRMLLFQVQSRLRKAIRAGHNLDPVTVQAPAQYLSIRYGERLAEAGAVTSVGSRGDSYDNALAETIIELYKTEVIRRRRAWKNIDDVEFAILEWVHWFNNRRLLESIGDIPPAEYEILYWTESCRTGTVGLTELRLH